MSKLDRMSIDTQILLLNGQEQTKAVQKQIGTLIAAKKQDLYVEKMREVYGDSYDEKNDWWPNKYPDM